MAIKMGRGASAETGDAQLRFRLGAGATRRADVPSDDEERLVWMLLTLIRERRVVFAKWYRKFANSKRTYDRDVAKLRRLGERHRFKLKGQKPGALLLAEIDGVADPARKGDELATETLAALVDALGEIVADSIRDYVDLSGSPLDGFLRLATPRLADASSVSHTYRLLRAAWANDAMVRFTYPSRNGPAFAERIVEPYLVTYNAGRYYLVAYDGRASTGGWRQFALDRMRGGISRAGTFVPKAVPERYRGRDAVGLFKRESRNEFAPSVRVTIALSPVIAESVTGRLWQAEQRVEASGDGGSTITFVVHDLGEAVRWACGFGTEARVLAPPSAVELARNTLGTMLAAYASGAERSAPA